MSIISCLYGKNNNYIDVTNTVIEHLEKHNHIIACNENFGDPYPGIVKELIITMRNGEKFVIKEHDKYTYDHIRLKCYYHIFACQHPIILDIVNEQLGTIMNSDIFGEFEVINCCLTGDDLTNYNLILDKINALSVQTNGKIKIHKANLGDTTAERYTLYSIKDDPDLNRNTYILYIHSKGIRWISNPEGYNIMASWRREMMEKLVTDGKKHINKFSGSDDYETIGTRYLPRHGSPDNIIPEHYSGNFWWARGDYLKRLFNEHNIGAHYYDTEFFLFRSSPKYYNIR